MDIFSYKWDPVVAGALPPSQAGPCGSHLVSVSTQLGQPERAHGGCPCHFSAGCRELQDKLACVENRLVCGSWSEGGGVWRWHVDVGRDGESVAQEGTGGLELLWFQDILPFGGLSCFLCTRTSPVCPPGLLGFAACTLINQERIEEIN